MQKSANHKEDKISIEIERSGYRTAILKKNLALNGKRHGPSSLNKLG